MSQREKLIARILQLPADFSWEELVRLLSYFGYVEDPSSGGSHRRFINPQTNSIITGLVKPHNRKDVGRKYLRMIIEHLQLDS